MTEEQRKVHEIVEKALFDLQDLPESEFSKSARADLWYCLSNQAYLRDGIVTNEEHLEVLK